MTRIIAGTLGGRTLRTPSGSRTRPTSDRVREALFSALTAREAVAGRDVLDLYAGSGALGLEALSRGAATATFVESDRKTSAVIRGNLADLGLRGEVVTATALAYATRPTPTSCVGGTEPAGGVPPGRKKSGASGGRTAYGLVLLDPPYDVSETEVSAVLTGLLGSDLLDEDALIVVERSARSPEPTWPVGLVRTAQRSYGETALWYAERDLDG